MQVGKVANFINNSPRVQGLLRKVNDNSTLYSAIYCFGLATLVRPTIIQIFDPNKENSKTSRLASIAAGITELAFTAALFIPFNKAINKASSALFDSPNNLFTGNKLALREFKSITNRGAKLLALIPMSWMRFSLISPMSKALFKDKKKGGLKKWA